MRRQAAQEWIATTGEVPVPESVGDFPVHNAIDLFLAKRIQEAETQRRPRTTGGTDYFRDVRPILEKHCYNCHQGGKVKGGLHLDSLAGALQGGRVDGPAIVPGDPEESPIILRITSEYEDEVMPAKGDRLSSAEIETLRGWIAGGAEWPEFQTDRFDPTPLADDLTFLRRVTLDTVGVVPSEGEIAAFLADSSPEKRVRVVDRLLADPRWADHWMGYWLDVLAENPNLINPTLNNTGPFRWWIHESLLDNKPLDLFVTELIRMEGSERFGGPAGFGVASGNDVPMAAKGIIVSSAFMGVEMKCARCHDAPTHEWTQEQLFSIAAMLETKPIKVPATSSVSLEHLSAGGRTPLIEVTLQPGSEVAPAWPFDAFCDEETARRLARDPDQSRDLLAALITAPQNERFAQVMANRIWERFMGRGLVEAVGDWEKAPPTHSGLVRWLGRELVRNGYDMKALARIILNSHAYQRAADPALAEPDPLFVARAPRMLAAEQVVDSLFAATGKPFELEPVNLDLDSVRTIDNALDLGTARRAWMLGSTSNERDRPSLTLPRVQAVAEVLEVFGWRGARPDASSGIRDVEANVLQPALLANGTMMTWLTRLSDDHGFTQLALEDQTLDQLLDRVYLRLFTRPPHPQERAVHRAYLEDGYEARLGRAPGEAVPDARAPTPFVAWSNHMLTEGNVLRLEQEAVARRGDPPTRRLDPAWRERFEDVIWALLNAPEFTRVM
jgi:mono/diheme cytochrome c family protein